MTQKRKKALVLSGGSVKGAFQAGAIKAVLDSGYKPDFISGISVGSLNGTFIANAVGEQMTSNSEEGIDWEKIGEELERIWLDNIKRPGNISRSRSLLWIIIEIVFKSFKGLRNTKPIRKLLYRIVKDENLSRAKETLELVVGTVNMVTSKLDYVDSSRDGFLDYVVASTAIPIIMPTSVIEDDPYLDGGLRDSAPLKPAIDAGVDEIICVLCHSEDLTQRTFKHGNIYQLGERIMDIISNETVTNDIKLAEKINHDLKLHPAGVVKSKLFQDKREIKIMVIRPENEIEIDLKSFNSERIKKIIDLGYKRANESLQYKKNGKQQKTTKHL